jgi:hypothetical protein|nr:MAG TPA: hypothetical protein [Caudoviricetes sp.]DAN67433.1 MAG TPA: hypothetical protein [Caudoviricetes sp.]
MKDLAAVRESIDYKGAIADIKALCLSLVLASCADEVLKWEDMGAYMAYVASKIDENISFIQTELEL